MKTYERQDDGGFFDPETGWFIPDDMASPRRRQLDIEVAKGRAQIVMPPQPAPAPPDDTPTHEQLVAALESTGPAALKSELIAIRAANAAARAAK